MKAASKFRRLIVGYIRVSSRAQDHAMQRSAILRAAEARGESIDRWYEEKRSAKFFSRPALDALRADARTGLIGRVYAFRLDRLTRTGIRDTFELVEGLRDAGVSIVTVADNFTLEGPNAELYLAMLAWAAKMERLAINERIAAARERLAEEGRPWGRPSRLTVQQVARIRQLRKAGRTVREVASTLKLPRSTVADALRRERLSGKVARISA